MQFRTIEGDGQRFVVSEAGDGPDVVMLHGFPDTPYSYAQLEEALVGAGFRVTLAWLRGYQRETIVPGRPYDALTIGRDALALLDALGLERPVLVGHDWGALITYVAVALAPQRLRAIVTFGIPHPSLLARTPANMWALRHFFALKLPWAPAATRRNDFAYFERLYRRWAPNWSGSVREQCIDHAKQALASPETLDGAISYYRAIPLGRGPSLLQRAPSVPGLIVGGSADMLGAELYTRTAALLPSPSRAAIVPGAGHWPHLEGAELVARELREFLAALPA